MQSDRQRQTVRKNANRTDATSAPPKRHIIRFGPEWADIIVIEGDVEDVDATQHWRSKGGLQSSEVYDVWAHPEW